MPGYGTMERLIGVEAIELRDCGLDATAITEAVDRARQALARGADEIEVWACFDALHRAAADDRSEPSDLQGIRSIAPGFQDATTPADPRTLMDRLHAAWLARCIGCVLGKPIEGFMGARPGLSSRQRQKTYLTAISPDEWPLRDYIPQHSPAEDQAGKTSCRQSTREHIRFVETDDDLRYTIIGQILLRKHGVRFGSAHVASAWLDLLPYRHVFTAETQAYRNFILFADVLRSEMSIDRAAEVDATLDWHRLVHHCNPYRQWIGAQIRCDSYGYAAPGNPALAAELAWRDARISHTRNGIYGPMLFAAMIALAFVENDLPRLIERAARFIPPASALRRAVDFTIEQCRAVDFNPAAFERVFDALDARFAGMDPVHTINNAAVVIAALLLGQRDFHRTVTIAVMGGLDTDCNGATAGSVLGAMIGTAGIPAHWSDRLNDTLHSGLPDYHPISIRRCAQMSHEIVTAQTT
jgi:ADP-ribosylglycohydrolase